MTAPIIRYTNTPGMMPDIIISIVAVIRAKALSKLKYSAIPPTTPSTFLSFDSDNECDGVF